MRSLIRPFTRPDQDHVILFLSGVWRDLGRQMVLDGKDADLADIAHAYLDDGGTFLLLEVDGLLVGTAAIRRFSEDVAELKRVYVAPLLRRQGLGEMLCQKAIDAAIALGYQRLWLDTTRESGPALALFVKLGFTEITRYNSDPFADVFMEMGLERAENRIRAILFDADGVLQEPRADRMAMWERLVGDRDRVDGFLNDLFTLERPSHRGETLFVDGLPEALRRWKCVGTVDDALQAWTAIAVQQAHIDLIASLRQSGVACYLATNQEASRRRYMSETLGYKHVFDAEFYSCDLGVSKPDPAFFRAILGAISIPPSEILFVDDKEANVTSARSVGIHAEVMPSIDLEEVGEHACLGVSALQAILANYGLGSAVQ